MHDKVKIHLSDQVLRNLCWTDELLMPSWALNPPREHDLDESYPEFYEDIEITV